MSECDAARGPGDLPVHLQMPRRRYLPFDATQYMRNFHVMVVDDTGEMVRGIAVALHDDRIAFASFDVEIDAAMYQIVQRRDVRCELESVANK